MNLWRFDSKQTAEPAKQTICVCFVTETASFEKKLVIRFSVLVVSCTINEERCFYVLVASMYQFRETDNTKQQAQLRFLDSQSLMSSTSKAIKISCVSLHLCGQSVDSCQP